jgi:hypothetical protein
MVQLRSIIIERMFPNAWIGMALGMPNEGEGDFLETPLPHRNQGKPIRKIRATFRLIETVSREIESHEVRIHENV